MRENIYDFNTYMKFVLFIIYIFPYRISLMGAITCFKHKRETF